MIRRWRTRARCLHGVPDGGLSWVHTLGAADPAGARDVQCLRRFGGCGRTWHVLPGTVSA